MAKAASPTPKSASAGKKTAAVKPRARTTPSVEPLPTAPAEPAADPLAPLAQRLDALEEKITNSFSSLTAELLALKHAPAPSDAPPDTFLPLVADLIRRSLMEHLTPVTAALKRLEERIGFIGNRLKYSGGGQDRQKPWRHDQARYPRPRGQHNAPRPGQGQPWTPPSAASVQGRFAPRPLRGGEEHPRVGEEEE
ncbi:MAG: hypothetical protein HYZ72_18170 [Deltaproteobacteria bacterium]|nr:hypothetical protein [Deltaproteobacteria bacterium]